MIEVKILDNKRKIALITGDTKRDFKIYGEVIDIKKGSVVQEVGRMEIMRGEIEIQIKFYDWGLFRKAVGYANRDE